jgi:signal transduction histidine kinase
VGLSRVLPSSLAGRLFLAVVLAVVTAQAVAGAILLTQKDRVARHIAREFTAERVPRVADLLMSMPADRRGDVLHLLRTEWTRYDLADAPGVGAGPGEPGFRERLRAAVPGDVGDIRAMIRDVPERGLGPDGTPLPDGDVLAVALRLPGGQWLNVQRVLHPPVPELLWPLGVSLALSALAVAFAAAIAVRRIVRPLNTLSDAVERLGRGETVAALPAEGPADVQRTTAAFNVMAERLTRFVADRTRMLAAIAHDLRTPIAGMRLRAEMIDDAETRERILAGLNDMAEMTEAALAFAKADAQEEATRTVDLASLVESVVDDFADMGADVAFDGPERLDHPCRSSALKRAVRNLVTNGVRYSGAARVRLRQGAEGVDLTVADDGPGIPETELERVFDPFVRLEQSRNRETGGTGLGLAIARTIARAHGGDVVLENRAEGGLLARLTLPASGMAA